MNYPFLGRKLAVAVAIALTAAACDSSASTEGADNTEAADTTLADTTATESAGTEVSDDLPTPAIDIAIEQDAKAGQNLTVEVTNFDINPEAASTETVDGEGHLHLYVDGERVRRFYNEALHLDLEPGSHEVTVELSSNDHSAWTVDGDAITATASIEVPDSESHDHSDSESQDVADFEAEPSVEVTVTKDPKSGWNVYAPVENFDISVDNASGEPVDGQGHLHLLVDGEQVERLYGSSAHIPNLDEGDHEITVELRGNDHAPLNLDGEPIAGVATVAVSAEEAAEEGHAHGDDDGHSDDDGHGHGESSGTEAIEDGLTPSDVETTIDVTIAGDAIEVELDGETVEGAVDIDAGTVVKLVTSSDVEEEVHLHGHDILVDVSPESDGTIIFTADIPGTLEVELEGSAVLLVNLRVS